MKILYIIGNGFDLNLGMKTSYNDFYHYYQSRVSIDVQINKLKKEISSDLKNWSDLELALGVYTEKIGSVQEFDVVFNDIGEKLALYLQQEESKFDFSKLDSKKLSDYLVFPERSLLPADRSRLDSIKMKYNGTQFDVYIMTFNYTRTIEKLIEGKTSEVNLGSYHSSKVILQRVEHIHGYADNRLVMGVNDFTQIKNDTFQNNQDILEALVKSQCNQVYKHTIDDLCKKQISSADLICIFGSSIGDTDNIWWELIGKQLVRGCNLLIFSKGEDISPIMGYPIGRKEREIRNYFLSKTNLTDNEKEKAAINIFVGYNTNMFNLNK